MFVVNLLFKAPGKWTLLYTVSIGLLIHPLISVLLTGRILVADPALVYGLVLWTDIAESTLVAGHIRLFCPTVAGGAQRLWSAGLVLKPLQLLKIAEFA
jgi:hypothetical protein